MQTITYDPTTHVLVPRYPTDEWVRAFFGRPDVMGSYMYMGDFGNIAYFYGKALETIPAPPQSSCTEKSYDSKPSSSGELESSGSNYSSNWQPIETAPKDELILVGPTKRMGICVAMDDSRDGWVTETCSEWANIYTPTHWMPLPPAPENKS